LAHTLKTYVCLLQVLFISNNKIADWKQIELLRQLPLLEHVVLTGNPLHEKHVESGGERATRRSARPKGSSLAHFLTLTRPLLSPIDWVEEVKSRLPQIKKLDGIPVLRD